MEMADIVELTNKGILRENEEFGIVELVCDVGEVLEKWR